MYSKIFQKLLMLDNPSISIKGRAQTVANLCEKIAEYSLEIVDPIADGGSMVDSSIIDSKNAYAHARYFNKKLVFKLPKKSKIPKTNEEFAEALLEQDIQNPNFLFDSKISFNVATDFKDLKSEQSFFEEFGLSFKLCPAGIYQRPVEIHEPNDFVIDKENPSRKVLKVTGYGKIGHRYGGTIDSGIALVKKDGVLSIKKVGESDYYRHSFYSPSNFEREYTKLLGNFQVQISKPFWVLDAEVTTQLFERVMGYTFNPRLRYSMTESSPLDKFLFMPEDNVDWDIAILFCNQLSQRLGFQPCYLDKDMKPILSILDYYELRKQTNDPSLDWLDKGYYTGVGKIRGFCQDLAIVKQRGQSLHYPRETLPLDSDFVHPKEIQINWDRSANGFRLLSDAEWLWACQGLSDKPYAGSENLGDVAWYYNNSGNKNQQGQEPHHIKGKQANSWGLYDMLGNVKEWCFDFGQEYKDIRVDSNLNRVPIWDMDKLKGLANSFRKDYYFGKPQDVSILHNPNYNSSDPKNAGDKWDFKRRIADRWSFVTHGGGAYQNPEHSGTEKRQVSDFSRTEHRTQLRLDVVSFYDTYLTTHPKTPDTRNTIGFRICKNVD